jgi:REP element-mobilizing transposase RayT
MRRARVTYSGAIHHVMNRGHGGEEIFEGIKNKVQFLDFLEDLSGRLKIRIIAYCIMNNHFHMILENTSGKLSEFMKRLNGLYGMYYRKESGGKGYVFQNRYHSTLIDTDAYLLHAIAYLLRNPVRAGIVKCAEDYKWSSIGAYYSDKGEGIVDAEFVNELFGTKSELISAIHTKGVYELPVRPTKYGEVLGGKAFLEEAIKKYDRRARPTDQSQGAQRSDDGYFDPIEKIIMEFEKKSGKKIEEIDTNTYEGKRQRAKFLVLLKDKSGLTYKEISKFDIFSGLNFDSLRSIYRNMRKRELKN